MGRILLSTIAALLILFTFPTVAAFAQNTPQPTTTTQETEESTTVETYEFKGEVTKVDGDEITVKKDDEIKEVEIPDGISIKRDTKDAKASDIKLDDTVTLTLAEGSDEVIAIDATSSSAKDAMKIAPFALVGILIALIALYLLFSKLKPKDHIKTAPTNLS